MTNAVLNAGVLVVLLVVSAPVLRRLRASAVLATVLLLCVLIAVVLSFAVWRGDLDRGPGIEGLPAVAPAGVALVG